MERRAVRIGPSIMTADLMLLGEQLTAAESAGVDFIHLDVMDGRFVPNISFGLPMLEAIRSHTTLTIDVHLMIVEPERWVERFVEAGADILTIHVEACTHLNGTIQAIRAAGATPGITLNPATPLLTLEEVVPTVGQILIMSVNPGFGGQTFIPSTLDRIRRTREMIDTRNPACLLEVDGGVKASNISQIVDAGADTFVVGSGIFAPNQDVHESVNGLRLAAG